MLLRNNHMERYELLPSGRDVLRRVSRGILVALLLCGLALNACEQGREAGEMTEPVPADLQVGETKFNANCARCHGEGARGTNQGPPLVHKIYEPSHHGDAAFYGAAAKGVRSHHWNFGNMPPVPDVTREDVAEIIRYVRSLQRKAGIM